MSQPRLATTTNRGRTYRIEFEGEILDLDSTTSIINRGVPKPALKAWGERFVAEIAFDKLDIWQGMTRAEAVDWLKRSPFRETDRAAIQGSDIHAWAERHVLDQVQEIDDAPEAHRPYLRSFLGWVKDFQPVFEASEFTGFNRDYGYAGTGDILAFVLRRNGLGLIDIKTGKGVYPEVGMQLAAYERFTHVILDKASQAIVPMPKVDWCAVLHLTPQGYEFIPVDTGEEVWLAFLYAQQVGIFLEDIAKRVLGAPMPVPAHDEPRPTYPPNVEALS